MPKCLDQVALVDRGTYYQYSFREDIPATLDGCGDAGIAYISLTPTEYTELTESNAGSSGDTFDVQAYDFAYEGILMSWVIGLSIGLILAMVARLKR